MDITKPIEIFRAGRHTAMDGRVIDVSREDLQAAVAAYDFGAEPAPIVVGHPKLDAPAYGWAGGLRLNGDIVEADPVEVEPAFAEMVNAGRFKRVSASLYLPGQRGNPRPEGYYLKHIGFLGAAAPSVRGLKPAHFSEDQDGASATFETEIKDPSMTDKAAQFAERETALNAREATLREREDAIAAAAAKAVHDGHVSFAEQLCKKALLAPAGRHLVVGLLDTLSAHDAGPVSFGEGDSAVELAPVDAFKKLFEGAQPIVSFGEHAPGDHDEEHAVAFAAPSGFTADPEALAHHARAVALQEKDPKLSYLDAIARTA